MMENLQRWFLLHIIKYRFQQYMHVLQVVGEDREYPVFRVQPKLNFDIDL